ncbi:MAG: phospholipid carrier-dependent glycosyltransferase [Candidatus Woesebacteria bacterium]|jgi:dolichyl-phosphate-mannose--protein O-mannosyl transferase
MKSILFIFKENFFLFLILAFSFFFRFWRLNSPPSYVFDEIYHVPAAKLSLSNDFRFYEWWHGPIEKNYYFDWLHPALSKYLLAISMNFLGINAFAWRFPSAICGVLLILATYFLGQMIFARKSISLLASFLLSLDGLSFVQSRIAMNDIFLSFSLVLALIVYFKSLKVDRKKSYFLLLILGLILGLALSIKWSAIFILSLLLLIESWKILKQNRWKKLPWLLFTLILFPATIYLLSFTQVFMQGKNLNFIFELHKQILWYQQNRDANHPAASGPFDWIIGQKRIEYWGNFSISSNYQSVALSANFALTLLSLFSLFFIIVYLFRNAKSIQVAKNKLNSNLFILLLAYFFSFLPWFLSPRIMFLYHYTPAMPLLVIIVAFSLNYFWQKQVLRPLIFLSVLFVFYFFFLMYPQWVAFPIS